MDLMNYKFEKKIGFHISSVAHYHIDDLVQDCSISIASALEILESWTKPSTLSWGLVSSLYLQVDNR